MDEGSETKPDARDKGLETAPVTPKAPSVRTSARIDAFLSHLAKCMQTRSGTETVLLFACYLTRLTGSVLQGMGSAAIRQSARRLVALAYTLPPSTTMVLATRPSPAAAKALRLGARFKALSALISEARTMGRLWGLLGLYLASKRMLSQGAPWEAIAQTASLIVFQAAENAAYLGSRQVLPLKPATQARLGLLSVRAWGVYVFVEGARLLVERRRKGHDKQDVEEWNKSFLRNLAWAPLTVHWGTTQGFLPDVAVSLLAFYPAVGSMQDLWTSTAAS